jgi:hypothetical protein
MPAAAYVLLSAVALLLVFVALVRIWLRAPGRRLTLRPEPLEPSAAEIDPMVDPMDVAFKALLDETPDEYLVHSLLAEWSQGKSCARCSKELSVEPGLHGPALMSPDRVTSEWSDVRAEEISEILATYQPICGDCHIIETLYRMHPELITEREPHEPHRA